MTSQSGEKEGEDQPSLRGRKAKRVSPPCQRDLKVGLEGIGSIWDNFVKEKGEREKGPIIVSMKGKRPGSRFRSVLPEDPPVYRGVIGGRGGKENRGKWTGETSQR